ncbi:hypothetical protein FNYG_12006 [Fusarium nygamai]|uniref:Uncharacterized protein n=1 Tax=Gibberella nygamai TaxID=42673 RepID=A0A2K0VXB5_GIBNY|nr:hypothetical protein FNYG_12006 [Fusarium nygamai]
MMAAVGGRMSTVRLLMDSGADMYAAMKSGSQLLSCAVEHPARLRYLLNHGGFDVNRQDSNGATVLHDTVMARTNEIAAARILLQKGARQFHATICYEDSIKEMGIHSGTPADVARDMGKVKLAELFDLWKYT